MLQPYRTNLSTRLVKTWNSRFHHLDRRGLDWGAWQPDFVYFKLPLPKVTTRVMCEFVTKQDLPLFIQEARRVNPGLSIQEARKDFFLMIGKITEAGQKTKTKDQKQLN